MPQAPSVYSATERVYCDTSEQGAGIHSLYSLCTVSLSLLNFALNREAFYRGLLWSAFLDSNICGLVISPKTRVSIHYLDSC